jgi:rubrerythrin
MTTFRPFEHDPIPVNEQVKSWEEMTPLPYDKRTVDPYTRARVILLNGIENGATLMKHALARTTDDDAVKLHLALTRRAESLQQQTVNWLTPSDQTVVETAIGYEQLAVDLTANLAQNESDGYFKQALDFALLEDFDHLYRYALLYDRLEGGDAEELTKGRTEIKPGRPTRDHHRHPADELRAHFDREEVPLRTLMNYFTIVSAEQQTMLFYKSHGFMYPDTLARQLFTEIADVEQQHVSQYEAVGDPHMTPLEVVVLSELNEAYNYFSAWQAEEDQAIKRIWREFLGQEIGHLVLAIELLERHEGRDAMDVLGADSIPSTIDLRPNIDYVNAVLQTQEDLQPYDMEFVRQEQLPPDWPSFAWRERQNGDVPPSDVIERRRPRERVKQPM